MKFFFTRIHDPQISNQIDAAGSIFVYHALLDDTPAYDSLSYYLI